MILTYAQGGLYSLWKKKEGICDCDKSPLFKIAQELRVI
jgi:hypothetical protein